MPYVLCPCAVIHWIALLSMDFSISVRISHTASFHSRIVRRGWGFFFWLNRQLFVTSDGPENKPIFPFIFKSGVWLNVTSVINANLATVYVNGTKLPTVEMKGDGSAEVGEKYVGLWCHKMIFLTGSNFKVKSRK